MALPYALPSSALPHAHQQHVHSHPRSPSQSSLNAWRASMSREPLAAHVDDEARDLERRGHSHSRRPSHDRAASQQASNTSAMLLREKPPPAALDTLDGWIQERTVGGKFVLTPGPGASTTPYSPPKQHRDQRQEDDDDHGHDSRAHTHSSSDPKPKTSLLTRAILPYTARFPILHAILVEKDSRRIFYFMTLNFCFMTVQAFYGYLTDSLGLLSDSIHMFFDCVALFVGLLAAVMSKWPPSQRFPYGFGKIETLSGFANGILLMLLSVEIAFEAFERLWEGTRTKRLGELFIVSSLGLAVNMVGMMAFGHHHHHHGHDHSHAHGHSHAHSHSHDHDHDHDHEHEHKHQHVDERKHEGSPSLSPSPSLSSSTPHSHSHSHSQSHSHSHSHEGRSPDCGSHGGHGHFHDNENMHGIYLHILADTLGSVSVIVSTVLTSVWGWSGWDPLASCLIAVLIFLSSRPLVVSSAKRLLLSVPESAEYTLRNTLGGILQQRGVSSYAAPKLWLDDRTGSEAGSGLLGVVHVTVARGAPMDDTRDRVHEYLLREGIKAVVQVEREGDNGCWCARGRTPVTPRAPKPF